MSLLDAINDRISQLQAATDANYKAAGYEVPTSAQRKAAELTGQNPYEYATQLKQIETAQKEAEKAAKAAQKQAAKAARQSSSRSSSGSSRKSSKSSKSSSAESKSAPSGNTGAMSSLFGSESETIPSIKDSEQTKQEAAKAWASSRKKDSASKLAQASTAAFQGVKFGNKKSENNVKSTSTTSTPKAEESSAKATSASNKSKTNNQNTKTSGGKETVATQLAQVSVQALKGVKPKASDNTSQTQTIPKYDPFPQGSMPKTLYDIRNAEMADLKVQQDKVDEVNQLVNQYRQEAAAKGVDLDAELAKMNDYTGENKSIEELAVELDMEKHPEKYSQDSSAQKPQSVKIDSTNVKDYLDPDRYLEDYEVEAAKAYIDEYKKTHEGFEDTVTLYNDAPNQLARYNRENGTNYSLRDYLNANGVSMDEYQEALSVQALEQKLSNAGAFASGFTRKESNMANLPDRIGNLITGGAISRGKADIERNATEAEKAAMFYSDLEKSRREKTTKGQETQNPLAYGAGSLTRMVYDTAFTKGIGDALLEGVNIPALNSSNPVVKNLAEIGLDTALVDIPTDTIPEIIENYNNGMPMDEIVEKAGWNIAGNVGINALMDWAIPSYISNMGKEATQQAEKEAAQYAENLGISTPFDLSNENINALIPNINNADNLSRQLQDSLNNQIEEPIRSVTDIPGAEPITVRQDIEGLQNQWDDYLKNISLNNQIEAEDIGKPIFDIPNSIRPTKTIDDFASEWDDIVKGVDNTNTTRFGGIDNVRPDIPNVTDVQNKSIRTGLNAVDPESNLSFGNVINQYTDNMKQAVDDWGIKHSDLLDNADVSTNYNNLKQAVDNFTDIALHSDDNIDTLYRTVEDAKDKLVKTVKQIDEAAANDKILGQKFSSNASIMKNADNARAVVNRMQPDISQAPTLAEDVKPVTEAISNMSSAKLETLKMRVINANSSGDLWNIWSEALDGNIDTSSRKELSDLISGKLSSLYPPREAATLADSMNLDNAGKNVVSPETPNSTPVNNVPTNTASSPRPQASGSSNVPGANPMQFFGGGKTDTGDWKTGKWRTNTAEKTGKIKNPDDIPVKDYAYHVFTEEAQKEVFDQRYADVDDVVGELLKPDHPFDEVDVRGAQQEWAKLMDAGDEQSLKKANRLGRKIASETREGGRVVQALAESTRNTPEGQLRTAQKAVNEIVDKQVGEGTSESLDNLVRKIEDAYENSKGDKEAFKKQVEELMQGDIKQYASKTKAKKMSPKKISGKTDVLKMIEDGADIDDIAEVVYKQNGGIRLTPEDQKTVYDYLVKAQQEVEGSYAQEELLARAAKIVQAKTPSTVGDKVRSILYNNMLGNFKTAISRNAFGNLAYQGIEQARQPIAAFVDKLVSLKTGQHSALGWNKGKASAYAEGFKKGAKEQLTDISKRIDTGRSGAKGWAEALRNNATTWDDTKKIGQFANSVDYYVRNAMELGDRPFYEANYKQAFTEMTQMLDRYGQSGVYGLADVPESDVYEVMDMIASVRAADSVFQKHGKMSKGLTELRNGLGDMSRGALGVDILSTQSTPFTMTPGNMLERAIEYTPLGVVKNTAETLGEVLGRKGFNQRRFVDEASRTITGIPMLWGAYELASNTDPESVFGSINGSYSEDPDEKAAQREDGYIEYGYNVPNWVPYYGGKTLDTSDLPVIGPMMQAGARMAEEGIENPRAWAQAAESIFGGSTTQGLRRLFGSDTPSYSGSQSVMDNVLNTIGSSGSQLVPSLMRQTAQTTDPYKRDLGEYGTAEYYYNMLLNNIPGLRQTLPVKTDVEGQPVLQNQGRSLPEKILENYILPMNVSDYDPSTLNLEASRLYNETGSAIAFTPQVKRSDLRKVDEKQGVEYSEEQFREYKENLGNLNSTMGNALIESDYYKSLSAEDQAKALQDVYTAMKAVANYNATKAETDNKIAKAYIEGQEDAAIKQLQLSKVLSDYDISSSSKIVEDIAAAVTAGNYDEAVQIASQYREATDYLKDNGITNNEKNREMYNSGQATELEDSEEAKRILKDAGYGFGENSYTRDLYNEGGLPAVQGYIDDMNAFTNAGVDASNDLYKDYQAAAQYWQSQGNGDLTATQFANSVKVLDTDKSSHVSQAEVIAYANENGLSEAEVNQLWGLYGSEWSYVPYVTNKGTWAAHKGS